MSLYLKFLAVGAFGIFIGYWAGQVKQALVERRNKREVIRYLDKATADLKAIEESMRASNRNIADTKNEQPIRRT